MSRLPWLRRATRLIRDDSGSIDAISYILIVSIMGLGMVCALTTVRDHLSQALGDSADAMATLNQSYTVNMTFAQIGGGTTVKTYSFTDATAPVTVAGQAPATMNLSVAPSDE